MQIPNNNAKSKKKQRWDFPRKPKSWAVAITTQVCQLQQQHRWKLNIKVVANERVVWRAIYDVIHFHDHFLCKFCVKSVRTSCFDTCCFGQTSFSTTSGRIWRGITHQILATKEGGDASVWRHNHRMYKRKTRYDENVKSLYNIRTHKRFR